MHQLQELQIGFIGFGHMAEVICDAFFKAHLIDHSQVIFLRKDKKEQRKTSKEKKISAVSLTELYERADLIIYCVRPKDLPDILAQTPKDIYVTDKLLISILAGVSTSVFTRHFGKKISLVRAMPNVPSAIGEGMTIFSWYEQTDPKWHLIVRQLFSSMGKVEEVKESFMDVMTALAGSGPAIVYQLIDAFARYAKKEGISYEKALQVVCQTFIGSAKLLAKQKDLHKLTSQIAVPSGTTEAALDSYRKQEISEKIAKVIEETVQRAKELHP